MARFLRGRAGKSDLRGGGFAAGFGALRAPFVVRDDIVLHGVGHVQPNGSLTPHNVTTFVRTVGV